MTHCCVSHQFLRAAKQNTNKIAVIHASSPAKNFIQTKHYPYQGDRFFTFAQLLESVDSLSSRLRHILDGNNLEAELINNDTLYTPKIIGLYMPPSVEYIISVLSVLRIGEAFLPLDHSWPLHRIMSIISSSDVRLVIACGSSFGEPLHESHWLLKCGICPVLSFSMEQSVAETMRPSELNSVWHCESQRQRLFCYLMYTSGTTGKPKGVCGTEQGLLNRFAWMQDLYPLNGEEVLLFKTSISFVDHLQEFLSAILTACTLVIPPMELKMDMFSIIHYLQAYSICRLTAVPSLLRAILPSLQSQHNLNLRSLKLLVLSGEVLPLSLWSMLSKLLPNLSILNLYGSTEASGDCTYFDCKNLPTILETDTLTSVPIGVPISHCDVVLIESDTDTPNQGEIYVGGLCISSGYFSVSTSMSSEFVKLHKNSICNCSVNCGSPLYFRTGDFAKRLQSGDLVFLGRKDRTVKVNGQRMALEEIEYKLREHPDVVDAAVISRNFQGEPAFLEAFILVQEKDKSREICIESIKSWMINRLPSAMIPSHFAIMESFPMSSSGKVDYASLASIDVTGSTRDVISETKTHDLLKVIKKVFGDALMIKEVSDSDNFFIVGGDSVAAAHVAHSLGIDMRMIYTFPTPSKLHIALLEKRGSSNVDVRADANCKVDQEADMGNAFHSFYSSNDDILTRGLLTASYDEDVKVVPLKRLKVDSNKDVSPKFAGRKDGFSQNAPSLPVPCSFSRCNKVMYEEKYRGSHTCQVMCSLEVQKDRKGHMQELWKVHLESCVDASPVVVLKDSDIYLFVGSHSHKFLCVNAKSGSVQWEIKLEGRVECSAAIVGDFSQVVVGCYKGKIYFIDISNGHICWTFQTCGEVKCQPVVDVPRQLIWCGSHDHNLYALDYRNHCCVYKLPCGGSIYGSPAIDEGHETLYVSSTSGRVTAISVKASPFHTLWQHELEVPVFASLTITSPNRYVICCLVDGHVVAIDSTGSVMWRYRTGGPIFAGACTSFALPSQVLVSSRNGSIYSFESEKGDLLWEYSVKDPITASAYVDENLQLTFESCPLAGRLVCVCSSSGVIHILRINLDATGKENESREMVEEFSTLELRGEIFSSPVMIGGRVFVGCRDDYVHCIVVGVRTQNLVEE